MHPALVGISAVLGIVIGLGGAFFLIKRQKKKEIKNIAGNIKKQDEKKGENQTPTDFYKGVRYLKSLQENKKAIKPEEDTKKVDKKKHNKKPTKKVSAKKSKANQKGKGKK